MDKILTLIIPSYNMEEYLPYCLDSLLIKKNFENLDILVINDGSKDRTLEIAKGYESKYPIVFRAIDKENGNYGSCINRGLKEAKGKYVKVLDADDSFDTQNFEEFVGFLLKTDSDLILSDFAVVNEDREIKKEIHYYGLKREFPIKEICSDSKFLAMEMHAVSYRTQILRDMDYHQTEGISYTDQQWIFAPMTRIKTVSCFNKIVYHYLIGRMGQTMNTSIQIKRISDRILFNKDMIEFYNESIIDEHSIIKYLDYRLCINIFEIYSLYFRDKSVPINTIVNFDNWLKKHPVIYRKTSLFNKRIKIWRYFRTNTIIEKGIVYLYEVLSLVSLKKC